MNHRLEAEIGEVLIEKRGWHWALTGFGFEAGVRKGIWLERLKMHWRVSNCR